MTGDTPKVAMWTCTGCGRSSLSKTATLHADDCPFGRGDTPRGVSTVLHETFPDCATCSHTFTDHVFRGHDDPPSECEVAGCPCDGWMLPLVEPSTVAGQEVLEGFVKDLHLSTEERSYLAERLVRIETEAQQAQPDALLAEKAGDLIRAGYDKAIREVAVPLREALNEFVLAAMAQQWHNSTIPRLRDAVKRARALLGSD